MDSMDSMDTMDFTFDGRIDNPKRQSQLQNASILSMKNTSIGVHHVHRVHSCPCPFKISGQKGATGISNKFPAEVQLSELLKMSVAPF